MTVALARAQVQIILQAVARIGVVHDWERFSNDPNIHDEWFYYEGKVRFWIIRSSPVSSTVLTCAEQARITEFELEGYMSVQDQNESRKDAETLVETVKDTFIAERTLNGTVVNSGDTFNKAGPEAEKITNVMLHIGERSELCHRMLVRFHAEERVAVTYS